MARSPKRSALVPVRRKPAPRKKLDRQDLSEHHPAVQAAIEPALAQEDQEQDLLKSIARSIAEMRDEARTFRASSGIEEIWRRCEEAYAGIDDMNRGEFQSMRWAKPMDPSGPVTTGRAPQGQDSTRSNVFLRLTSRFVDVASSKLAEIILPPGEKAFSLTETPDPDLIEARSDKRQVVDDATGIPLTRPLMEGETPPGQPAPAAPDSVPPPGPPPGTSVPMASSPAGGVPAAPNPGPAAGAVPGAPTPAIPGATPPQGPAAQKVPLTVADLAEEKIQLARKKAKKAETIIYDWHVETQFRAEARRAIFDSSKLGVGVLKGPVPKVKKAMAVLKGDNGKPKLVFKEKVIPETPRVNPWNFFPDPSCGENPQNGNHCFERDWLSEKQLRNLRDEPGYIGSAIDEIIKEGPDKIHQKRDDGAPLEESVRDAKKGRYEVWYFYGFLKKSELNCVCQASGYVGDESDKADDEPIPTIGTMINERMIKAVPTVLESGKLPYRTFSWTIRSGSWAGVGVAEQLFTPQRMLNGANRAMMNNAGKSAGSQIVVDQSAIRPANNDWRMVPDKVWYKSGDAIQAIKDVFEIYDIPNVTDKMMKIIVFSIQMAEESTSMPLTSLGLSGKDEAMVPETLGHAQLHNTNANQLLRDHGYRWDEGVTEPLVRDEYEYLLLDPDVPDDAKGDFAIDAHGSVAMVERSIQDQKILALLPIAKDPAYGIDPKRVAVQVIKSSKLNPADFKYSPEEQSKIDSTPPPEDPRIGAARETMKGWVAEAKIKAASDDNKTKLDHDAELRKLEMQRQIALLGYANQNKIKITEVQAELAKASAELSTQERLAEADRAHERDVAVAGHAMDLHKHRNPVPKPPTNPPGRARNGKSFSQVT